MDLKITMRQGLIGLNVNQGTMNIDYGKSNYKMKTRDPKIDMEITQPEVMIDQTIPLAEIGLKKVTELIKTSARNGRQECLEGIGKIVQQGNELSRIDTGVDPIPSQAKYNAFDQKMKEVNIDFIPKSRPEITLNEGKVEINLQEGDVDIESKPQDVHLDLNRAKVEVYIRQKPFIDIEYIGNSLDMSI
ncbi:DUF6470 family protein [Wukongibacter baidiensis]|uniref:DUF6470 family protein n=1 Tax=Wukongibacter baidiensis TaxID=1723361 RepID=UPI003D7F6C51